MLSSVAKHFYTSDLYEGIDDPVTVPTDPAPAPTDPATVPTDPATVPADPAPAPTDPVTVPTDPTPAPTDPVTVPTDPAPAPTDPVTVPTDPTEEDSQSRSGLLTTTNFNMVIMFIFIYVVAYTLLGVFYKHDGNITMSFIVDILFSIVIIGIFYVLYYRLDSNQQQELLNDRWKDTKEYINDDFSIAYQSIFIVLFYAIIYLFRIPMSNGTKPAVIFVIETLAWLLLLFILTNKFFITTFNVSLIDDFGKLFENELGIETTDNNSTSVADVTKQEEVFNVSGNKFTYEDAQAVCKSYGASLASYEQIEKSYNNGAEWCNYGWSANQMAFFPTQKQTWQKLQVSDKYKNSCGRPGVNGGYMRNPNIRFGVNCFGKKPEPNDEDMIRIQNNEPSIPIQNDLNREIEETLDTSSFVLSGFNYNKWNK